MDWDKESHLLWNSKEAQAPTSELFEDPARAVQWRFAIEALASVYGRMTEPVPPSDEPWMLWADGTISTPSEISKMRPEFDVEVARRGGANGQRRPDEV